MIVQLSATDVPSALQFSQTDSGPKSFNVSITSPLETSFDFVGEIEVTGRAVIYPSTLSCPCSSDSAVVRIDQYSGLDYQYE